MQSTFGAHLCRDSVLQHLSGVWTALCAVFSASGAVHQRRPKSKLCTAGECLTAEQDHLISTYAEAESSVKLEYPNGHQASAAL